MDGIINKYFIEMIKERLDEKDFLTVLSELQVDEYSYITGENYSDHDTISLVTVFSEISGKPTNDVLEAFGSYWITRVGGSKYGSIINAGGHTLSDFITNLPFLHGKVLMMFENIDPPSFIVEPIDIDSFLITYTSMRSGLGHLVKGMLIGLADYFNESADVFIVNHSEDLTIYTFKLNVL